MTPIPSVTAEETCNDAHYKQYVKCKAVTVSYPFYRRSPNERGSWAQAMEEARFKWGPHIKKNDRHTPSKKGPCSSIDNPDSNCANPYCFTGERFSSDLGMSYLRARWYNQGTGWFLTMDTSPIDVQNPFERNRSVSTANNPVNTTDPGGLAFNARG